MQVSRKTLGIFLFATLIPVSTMAGDVSGRVTSAQSLLPISNAMVRIMGGPFADTAFTDGAGNYTLPNIPPNIPASPYIMIVTAPLFNSAIRNNVTVPTGALTQNFSLLVTATVRGAVTNSANGNAVSGARVVLTLPSTGSFVPETTTTDGRGMYQFDSVSNSGGTTYRITVSAAGFQTAVNNTVIITDARRSGIADFSLIPMGVSGTGSITGTVASANSGLPMVGATVVLTHTGSAPETTVTNAQGQYRFDSLAVQGGYTVTTSATNFNNSSRVNVGVIDGQTTVVDLNPNSSLGAIWGQVLQVNTIIPIPFALIRILDTATRTVLDSAHADAQGWYDLYYIPAGTYILIVTAPNYNSNIRNNVVVTLNSASNQNFSLQITATIRGTVTNSSGGAAVNGARVVLTLPSNGAFVPETVYTNSQGAYLFDSVSNSGGTTYRITVTAAGFQTAVNNTVIITDALRSGIADFNLIPVGGGANTGSVSGQIASFNSGVPIAGAIVLITRNTGSFAPQMDTTDANGFYSFTGIPDSAGYVVSVSMATFNNATSNPISVIAGQTTVVNLNPQSSSGILPFRGFSGQSKRVWINGRLTMEFSPSHWSRKLEVYDVNGTLRHRISVPSGAMRAEIPAGAGRTGLILIH